MSGNIDNLPRWFELSDGVHTCKVHLYEALEYTQTYEKFGGSVLHRMLSGKGIKQTNWAKLRTALSGNGGMPLGFSALNYAGVLTLKCGTQRAISQATNVIVIPAARRTDTGYEPVAFKCVDGFWVEAAMSLSGNTATITADGAATAYMAQYYPQLSVLMDDPNESYNWGEASSSWSITAEEE